MKETPTIALDDRQEIRALENNVQQHQRLIAMLSFRKIGAVYILVLASIAFSFLAPSTFPQWATVQQVLSGNAILALMALPLIVPLSAGVFDLSTSYTMSLCGVLVAELLTVEHMPMAAAVILTVLVAVGIGLFNGVIVVGLKIDSFIGTLAMGSLIAAGITAISADNTVQGPELGGLFAKIGQGVVFGFSLPVFYAAALAIVLWFFMGHTAPGRRLYAAGFNANAARLAGVRVDRLRFWALVYSSTLAGLTGVVFASQIGAGSPTAGTPYLLPAYAAVFLGATQIEEGRFNAVGTVIAVLLLGVGTTGLGLADAPEWSQAAFTGVVLIAALAVTGAERQGRGALSAFWRQRLRRLVNNAEEDVQLGGVSR